MAAVFRGAPLLATLEEAGRTCRWPCLSAGGVWTCACSFPFSQQCDVSALNQQDTVRTSAAALECPAGTLDRAALECPEGTLDSPHWAGSQELGVWGGHRPLSQLQLRLGGLREHSGLLTLALGSFWMTCAGLCSVACGLYFYLGLEILNLWLELDLTQKDLCSARKGPAPGETVHCPPVAGTWAWEPPRCPEFAPG